MNIKEEWGEVYEVMRKEKVETYAGPTFLGIEL